MAREIRILRRLDHPNVMKLEGIITSKLSSHIYLVFEYMEHDLSGLVSCPDIKFTDSQIKCYMKQLLSGMEHCHSRGILHRDIKSSNILENNQGVLKIADFGLANFAKPKKQQNLTGRVVTLWYRPPELLLGATNYGEAIDLWSVGCVFAEMFVGRPLLKGRTEVCTFLILFLMCFLHSSWNLLANETKITITISHISIYACVCRWSNCTKSSNFVVLQQRTTGKAQNCL